MCFFYKGAELDILPTVTSWRNVSHLVFEYSFTKRRDMAFFWDVISQLRGLGFDSIAFKDYTGLVSQGQFSIVTWKIFRFSLCYRLALV